MKLYDMEDSVLHHSFHAGYIILLKLFFLLKKYSTGTTASKMAYKVWDVNAGVFPEYDKDGFSEMLELDFHGASWRNKCRNVMPGYGKFPPGPD